MYYCPNDEYKEYFDCTDKLMELCYGEPYDPNKCIDRVDILLDCNGIQQTKVINKTFTQKEIENLLTELYNNSEYIELTLYRFDVILDGEKTLMIALRTNDNTNRLIKENRGSLVGRINKLNTHINPSRCVHCASYSDLHNLNLSRCVEGDILYCVDNHTNYVVSNNRLLELV